MGPVVTATHPRHLARPGSPQAYERRGIVPRTRHPTRPPAGEARVPPGTRKIRPPWRPGERAAARSVAGRTGGSPFGGGPEARLNPQRPAPAGPEGSPAAQRGGRPSKVAGAGRPGGPDLGPSRAACVQHALKAAGAVPAVREDRRDRLRRGKRGSAAPAARDRTRRRIGACRNKDRTGPPTPKDGDGAQRSALAGGRRTRTAGADAPPRRRVRPVSRSSSSALGDGRLRRPSPPAGQIVRSRPATRTGRDRLRRSESRT